MKLSKSFYLLLATLTTILYSCGSEKPAELQSLKSTVEFHIAAGTGENSWNTKETIVKVSVGDTLVIINDDSMVHRLHTNGKPFAHGASIEPGQSAQYAILKAYDPAKDGPLYDHNVGSIAKFWLKAD